MKISRTSVACLIAFSLASAGDRRAALGQEFPNTLMHWNYGATVCETCSAVEPIETERPHFTRSASVVGLGIMQLETGYTYYHDDEPAFRPSTVHTLPEALFRFGALDEWLELQIGWTWIEVQPNNNGVDSGGSNLYLGAKFALTPQQEVLPKTAIVLATDVSLESSELLNGVTDELDPGFDIVYHWDLPGGFATAGQTRFHHTFDRRESSVALAQSWLVSRDFGSGFSGYAEWFMLAPDDPEFRSLNYLDGGLKILWTRNLQGDFNAGVGLTDAAADYFVGTGLSIRR
jgi:hypothetical protein